MPKTATALDKSIGERIRSRRVELKMSQSTLGRALGVSFQQVQKYENGRNKISADALKTVATTLAVSIGYLLGAASLIPGLSDNEQAPYDATTSDMDRTGEAMELHRSFNRISDPQLRQLVLQMARSLAERDASADHKAA
jgi:transcriptional regulator with XRE-family HTH domain